MELYVYYLRTYYSCRGNPIVEWRLCNYDFSTPYSSKEYVLKLYYNGKLSLFDENGYLCDVHTAFSRSDSRSLTPFLAGFNRSSNHAQKCWLYNLF